MGSGGPVFINPSVAAAAASPPSAPQGSFVTQTVYGFLDFTTTIGNTVMVFSPQSAAAGINLLTYEDVLGIFKI